MNKLNKKCAKSAHSFKLEISFTEYIALSAFMTALTAISIDIMLPALPAIARNFELTDPNQRQLIIIVYFLGFGIGQLFWGPISDRFGRLPILTVGLCIFIAGSIIALFAQTFEILLLSRIIQGVGSASSRVIVFAIVRDLFLGAYMARVISLIMTVFITVPILAPILGQGLLHLGNWRLLFAFILFFGLIGLLWSQLRLPETRPPSIRDANHGQLLSELVELAGQTKSLVYMVATGLLFGCLYAFIANSQQIFGELYELGDRFVFAFAAIALAMSAAALTNAHIVMRRGMRCVCHSALILFTLLSAALAVTTAYILPPVEIFLPWLAAIFFLFNLISSNFNAIVLQPMGNIAGLATSMLGFSMSFFAAILGWIIGTSYDGTLFPFSLGFFLLSASALVIVFFAEGRNGLFID